MLQSLDSFSEARYNFHCSSDVALFILQPILQSEYFLQIGECDFDGLDVFVLHDDLGEGFDDPVVEYDVNGYVGVAVVADVGEEETDLRSHSHIVQEEHLHQLAQDVQSVQNLLHLGAGACHQVGQDPASFGTQLAFSAEQ